MYYWDLKHNKNIRFKIEGRHDPAIVRRANIVVEKMTSFVMLDLLIGKYGNDLYVK